jgi:hypothetical protein
VEWPGGEHRRNSFIAENAEKTKESSAVLAFSALESGFGLRAHQRTLTTLLVKEIHVRVKAARQGEEPLPEREGATGDRGTSQDGGYSIPRAN